MTTIKQWINPNSGALIHDFRPLRIYIYPVDSYPYKALTPLTRAILHNDPHFAPGRYLFQIEEDASQADFIHFPCDLNYFEYRVEEVRPLLTHYVGNEARHLFFDDRDQTDIFPDPRSICLKVSLHDRDETDRVMSIPYMDMVDDFIYHNLRPTSIRYDVSFIGQASPLRERICGEIAKRGLKAHLQLKDFYFFQSHFSYQFSLLEVPEQTDLEARRNFIRVMRASRFSLAIQGYGLNSYRFFESLSMGIPPILISDHCALPFADLVDYPAFTLSFHPEEPRLAERLAETIHSIDEDTHRRMGRQARHAYDTFLSSRSFNYILHYRLSSYLNAALQERVETVT